MTLGKSGSSFKNGSGSGVCDLIERKGIKPKCKNSEFGVLFCIEWVLTLNSITQHYSLIHCWLGLRAAIGSSIWPRAPMTRAILELRVAHEPGWRGAFSLEREIHGPPRECVSTWNETEFTLHKMRYNWHRRSPSTTQAKLVNVFFFFCTLSCYNYLLM